MPARLAQPIAAVMEGEFAALELLHARPGSTVVISQMLGRKTSLATNCEVHKWRRLIENFLPS